MLSKRRVIKSFNFLQQLRNKLYNLY